MISRGRKMRVFLGGLRSLTALRRTASRLAMAIVFIASLSSGWAGAATYTFGVVSQFEPRRMFAIWQPIIDELERRTGDRYKLTIPLTITEFEQKLDRGEFDFVYANPYHIMRVYPRQGYIPLVRDSVPLRGIVVVRKDSPVEGPRDLAGKLLAVPSPNSIGGSLLIRADLDRLFGVRVRIINVKTHSSAYLNALNGLADAAGGVEKTLAEQDPAVRNGLRVIYTTREMPSHPIAAHPRIDKSVREAVRKALLDMAATATGRTMLTDVPMRQPVSASIDDYLVMRNWGLESYWTSDGQ
jgi:phosphonate transport system substrate-binding protein